MDERFDIREIERCVCGMRRFVVTDNVDGAEHHAEAGRLSRINMAHVAVSDLLARERKRVA